MAHYLQIAGAVARGTGDDVGHQNRTRRRAVAFPQFPTLIGLACFWAILEEAHITLLAIYPDYQRQGLGKLLLYKLLEKAVQRQLERATLEVRVSNQSAIALYEHFGFRIAGERKNYYPQTGESALIFWRNDLQRAAFREQLNQWRQEILSRLARGEWQLEEETRAKIDIMGMQ
ncbi:ribosomal protein S18-alanine N-acetyltransferase [Microcystis aeruginosa]|uniref:ribosomal protein S18-alanine N-acetyltransferase n=1 Tax=Microcystis aeruginosa TaxID=1126 RepID=UPI0035B53B9B